MVIYATPSDLLSNSSFNALSQVRSHCYIITRLAFALRHHILVWIAAELVYK